jgi:hypothetical protein
MTHCSSAEPKLNLHLGPVVGVVFGMSEDWNATGISSRVSGDVERNM